MRITNSMLSRLGVSQLAQNRSQLALTQERAATGRRINRPSDDPIDYRAARDVKTSVSETDRFMRAIDSSRSRIGATESAVSSVVQLLSEARVRALEAANDTNDVTARPAILIAVESLFDRLFEEGNAQSVDGGYLFSGLTSTTPAFSRTGVFASGSPPPVVTFDGDGNQIAVEIDQNVYVDVTLDGSRVFQGGIDLFQTLGTLWTGIDQDDNALIQQALSEIEAAEDQVLSELARVGDSDATADRFEERLLLRKEQLAERLSLIEDADVFQVYSDLASQETALQASLQVTSSMLGPSLLDFI